MVNNEERFKKIISHAKEYGCVYKSSEIYDGLSATYDYGPFGVELKNNIKSYWWKSMVNMHNNIVGLDTAIFMHPTTWKASGHIDAFNDPLIDNKDSKKRYRADILIENYISKLEMKIEKECEKAEKKYGEKFKKATFLSTNSRIIDRQNKIDTIKNKMNDAFKSGDLNQIHELIINLGIKCPVSGTNNWTEVRQFNLMFETKVGATTDNSSNFT